MSIRNRVSCAFAVALLGTALAGVNFGRLGEPVYALSNPATTDVIAAGLNNPRGLNFGPDGTLYVAEAGSGGGRRQCTQDPNLRPRKKGFETCSTTLRSPTTVSKVWQ